MDDCFWRSMNWEKVGGTPPTEMSEVDDNKAVIVKIFKTLDLE